MASNRISPISPDVQPDVISSRCSSSSRSPSKCATTRRTFKTFLMSSLALLTAHLHAFVTDLDATRDCTTDAIAIQASSEPIPNNPHYYVPFVIMLINIADTGIIFARGNFKYNSTGMEDLFTHHIYLPEFWYTGTVILHIVIAMNTAVFVLLLFKPMLESRYIIFLCHDDGGKSDKVIQGGRAWKPTNAERFLKFRQRGRSFVRFLQLTVYCTAVPYWFFGLLVNYKGQLRDFIFILYLPVFILYSAFGCVFISFYSMLVANYMRIQQTFLLEQIEALTEKIRKPKNTKRLTAERIWRHFTSINNDILQFFYQLRAVNRFWSPLLSVYFLGHITMEVYLIYGFLFDDEEYFDWFRKSYFVYFAVEFIILLMAITAACSAVVRHNVKIYKTNVSFCYAFTKHYKVGVMCQLKMSQMIANYKGTRNGFRLVTNYIIDSRMFEAIFFYISTVFMKILKS